MQTFRTEAIILRRTNYGEADRILNLLTPERGKLSAIAKGVRKSKSKLAGGLELFATCDVTIMQGKSDMGTVSSARLVKFYGDILKDYDRMQLAYELIKMVNRATETVGESEFYYLLRDGMVYLNELSVDYRIVELWFRLRYASALGVGLNLVQTAQGEALKADQRYNFDFGDMAFSPHPSGRFGSEQIKLLRLAHAKDPAILRQVSGLGVVLDDCLWLVRALNQ
ncbi:MAG TPA: DNA repair protein RecO [Candidatus Saccharimonadales bacterium]|nr:DNA repair protein RecO [Candidatus Saccharimonadales bacterium]